MATDALFEATYYGTWRIVECVSLSGTVETTGIEGTEFHLDENGDVSWKVSEDGENMPFFSCESYELNFSNTEYIILKFRGTYAGHVIEFRVDVADDLMLLTYERCCMLQCQKISSCDPKQDTPFSFQSALEEGYFSDMIIYADTGKEFKVHSIILALNASEIDWSKEPPPLSGCQEDVLHTILHYLYTECLPRGLSEETAKQCIQEVVKLPGFSKFSALCDTFLKNTALKEQITNLITDMHGCADRIVELFTTNSGTSNDGHVTIDESLMSTPAKLSYLLKQAMREAAVAGIKLVILCDLFSRRKGELSREERHDIIKYTRSRLPIFMQQVKKFLDAVTQHCSSLTASQREDLATFFVPELETVIETVSQFGNDARAALDYVIKSSAATSEKDKPEKSKKGNVGDVLGRKLRNALHVRELKKLKKLSEKASQSYGHLTIQKDRFLGMSLQQRVRLVSKTVKQVVEDLTVVMRKLEEFMSEIDEKLTWREWKYLFKLGTSKVSWVLNKSQTNKQTLQSLIKQTSDMVHREQFAAALSTLGLSDNVKEDGTASQTTTTKYAQLSSVESLCVPPFARDSNLARKSVELLKNGTKTDMTFEVIQVSENTGDEVIDHTNGESDSQCNPERDVDVNDIPAHCVIIAARCDWYRRALLSGMRESIDKKITVHDTNPRLFRLLLEYLYSGQVDANDLSTEQLADLMTLADRYEVDSLKCVCEQSLKHHLDDETSLYMLSLADQLNAKSLKDYTIAYLVEHPHIAGDDVFNELPDHLQAEVEDAITWNGLNPRNRNLRKANRNCSSSDSSISEVDELVSNLNIPHRPLAGSTSSSSDDLQFAEDDGRRENCLTSLRDIVGDSVPQEELVRVAIAADYDINRALNFFFS